MHIQKNLQPLPRLVSSEDSPSPACFRSEVGKRGSLVTFSPAVRTKTGLLWRYVQDACELSFVMGGASDSSSIIGLTEARMMVANLRGVDVSLIRKGDRGVRQLRGKAVSELREYFHSLESDSVRGAAVLRDLVLADGLAPIDSLSESSSSSSMFAEASPSSKRILSLAFQDSGFMTDTESDLPTWDKFGGSSISSSSSTATTAVQSRLTQRLRCTLTGGSSAQEIFDDTDFIDAPDFESEMLVHSTSLERQPNRNGAMTGSCMMRAKRHSITDDDGFHIISEAMSTPTTTDDTGSEAISDSDSTLMMIRQQMGARGSISLGPMSPGPPASSCIKKKSPSSSSGRRKKLTLADQSSCSSTYSEESSSAGVIFGDGSFAGPGSIAMKKIPKKKTSVCRPSLKRQKEQSGIMHMKLARLMHAPFDV